MEFGSFLDNRRTDNVRYCYRKSGLEEAYPPDLQKEAVQADWYDAQVGNLFFQKPVAWQGAQLTYGSIDIVVQLPERRFVDHAALAFGEGTELRGVECLTHQEGRLQKIGVLNPQTGSTVQESEVTIPVGIFCDHVIVRLKGAYHDVIVKGLELKGAWKMDETVFPLPEHAEFCGTGMRIDQIKSVHAKGEDASFAARYLADRWKDKTANELTVDAEHGDISMELIPMEGDGFQISSEASGCRITAGSRRGLLYAVEAVMQLIQGNHIKACRISDRPFMNFRGVHVALPSRSNLPFLKQMIQHVFVPMRYNAVFIQVSGAMRYDRFPEINDAWLTACDNYEKGLWPLPAHYSFVGRDILEKEEVAELCDYFRSYGMEVIPEVQSWSHCQYITMAYPELAEEADEIEETVDTLTADVKPDQFYKHSMCPTHPRYYDVIFGIADEVIDVVKPERFVHMGHDEIYQVCICDRCKEREAGELYAEEVSRLNDYVKRKGLTMMIWSDMLQERNYLTVTGINRVPKDVIMLDFTWYFHLDDDLEDNLLSHDFQVVMGNLYSSHYPRYEARSKKVGILGAEVSTWVECSEKSYSFTGKMYDFVYTANMIWNRNYDGSMRLSYDQLIQPLLLDIRRRIGGLTLTGGEELLFEGRQESVPGDLIGQIPYRYAAVCSAAEREVTIPVHDFSRQLSFVHATDVPGEQAGRDLQARKIGEYRLCYEDGTEAAEDILVGDHIYHYHFRFGTPISSRMFRHRGYTASYSIRPVCGKTSNGEDYTLYECFVKNPFPEKKIASVKLIHAGTMGANILLFSAKK